MLKSTQNFLMIVVMATLFLGCANMPTAGKIALTPVTITIDSVDAVAASGAVVFEAIAKSSEWRAGQTNYYHGYNSYGGFGTGTEIDVTYPVSKIVSWTFGGVDYVFCRSFYPNYPKGVSPWKKYKGHFFYLKTRALWNE